jgi:hypothetical protein
MFLHGTEASYVQDDVVWLRFNGGMVGEVDLSAELEGRSSVPCVIRSHSRHSTWLTTPCRGKTARIWPQNSSTNRCVPPPDYAPP